MASVADAAGAVDFLANVVVATGNGLAGVQPDAHTHGTRRGPGLRRQRALCGQRRGHCITGHAEHGEKRVALGVDLQTAVRGKGLAQQSSVRLQQFGPGRVAMALGQARRAFDVAEEQRQDTFGQGA
ncbi:MAG: hypothetical protein ABIR94_19295 [Rubrivivax sp.]